MICIVLAGLLHQRMVIASYRANQESQQRYCSHRIITLLCASLSVNISVGCAKLHDRVLRTGSNVLLQMQG